MNNHQERNTALHYQPGEPERSSYHQNVPLLHRLSVLKLRHVRQVAGCNFQTPGDHLPPKPDACLPSVFHREPLNAGFFVSLHVECRLDSEPFFISELQSSLSPLWDPLQVLNKIPQNLQVCKGFVIRVWYLPSNSSNAGSSSNDLNSNCCQRMNDMCSPCKSEKINKRSLHFFKDRESSPSHTRKIVSTSLLVEDSSPELCPVQPEIEQNQCERYNGSESHNIKYVPPKLPFYSGSARAELVVSWAVKLSGLVPVGCVHSQVSPNVSPNTLLIRFLGSDMFYTAADCILSECVDETSVEQMNLRRLWYGISLPMSQTKQSYTPATLTKLHQNERDVSILERRCAERMERLHLLHSALVKGSRENQLQNKIASTKTRIKQLQRLVSMEKRKKDTLRSEIERLDEANHDTGMHLLALLQQLGRDRQQLQATCGQTEQQVHQLLRTRALLAHRRSTLVQQLAQVYPIVAISGKDDFAICNLWIPDASICHVNTLKTPMFSNTGPPRSKTNKPGYNNNKPTSTSEISNKVQSSATDQVVLHAAKVTAALTRPLSPYPPYHPHPDTVYVGGGSLALPHSTESLSAALSMAVHLLCLVSGLLQMPLRYPVSRACFMPTIADLATTQLPQNNRKPERSLAETLPDLRCYPLLTPQFDLKTSPLVPYIPQHCIRFMPSCPTSTFLPSQVDESSSPSVQSSVLDESVPNSASTQLSPRNPQLRHQPHLRSHSQTGFVIASSSFTPNSHSLSQSPQHCSKSPSASHVAAVRKLLQNGSKLPFMDMRVPSYVLSNTLSDNLLNYDKFGKSQGRSHYLSRKNSSSYGQSEFEQKKSERRSILDSTQISYSLDQGLDHIKDAVANTSKHLDMFLSTKQEKKSTDDNDYVGRLIRPAPSGRKATTGSLTNLTKDKCLIVQSESINFEDPDLARFEDETTDLLRSWHENSGTPNFTGNFVTCGSTDDLDETGIDISANMGSYCKFPDAVDLLTNSHSSEVEQSDNVCQSFDRGFSANNCSDGKILKNCEIEILSEDCKTIQNVSSISDAATLSDVNDSKKSSKTLMSRTVWPFSRSGTNEDSCFDTKDSERVMTVNAANEVVIANEVTNFVASDPTVSRAKEIEHESNRCLVTSSGNEIDSAMLESEKSDKLLHESLAALSEQLHCSADLSNLSDLTAVTDRTAKLASKSFSFKIGPTAK